ncbi:hypothetical protein GBA63_03185 [Rubrobacter tropicus]|uniref:Uncharacterized protein n=1 Tax=Rubrobacter tropicus TaxID=2653851 RepID=A0A6G8Q5L6_9ACTN|nr:hypothetical protein [Rubrobacter tropicus]QIN81750.1 hypothetical protein GBA63_03185 [Rubrobacter tropicus]
MHGMGNDPRLARLHREEVAREVRSLRRPRSSGARGTAGLLSAFWRELGADAGRLVGVFGLSVKVRKRKGAA